MKSNLQNKTLSVFAPSSITAIGIIKSNSLMAQSNSLYYPLHIPLVVLRLTLEPYLYLPPEDPTRLLSLFK